MYMYIVALCDSSCGDSCTCSSGSSDSITLAASSAVGGILLLC